MKVAILTLGCRVNQSESHVIEGTLRQSGISIVNLSDNPDYCIVNTCAVTAKSDYNSRQSIRKAVRAGAKVIVTGCYSQIKPDTVKAMHGVHSVLENSKKNEIVKIITEKSTDLYFGAYSRSRPFLKVQEGCNYNCSYCAVPMARGRSKSVSPDTVTERAQLIETNGYREIVLTGVHLGTYGKDLSEKCSIHALIQMILKRTLHVRIRISSLEINEVDDEFFNLLHEQRICCHLHLPLQSGSNKILSLMNRMYRIEDYVKKIEKIVSTFDNIAIGTDIIVGFPGEDEKDFSETLDIVRAYPFSYLHIFPFSVRPGTISAKMINRNNDGTIKRRCEKLFEMDVIKRHDYMSKQIGKVLDVIPETSIGEDAFIGTSSNYLKISVSSKIHSKKSLVSVIPINIVNNIVQARPIF